MVALEALALVRYELDERLAGVAALADDEVAQVAGVLLLVVRGEPLLARPVADEVADPVADVGGDPAALDVDQLVPAARLVEAELELALGPAEKVYSHLLR